MIRPKEIQIAAILYLVALIVSVPSLIINTINAPEEQSKTAIIIIGLIFFGLYFFLGYLIYLCKNWARILYTALCFGGFILAFTQEVTGQHHVLVKYIGWFQSALTVAIIVLIFMPKSRIWFNET